MRRLAWLVASCWLGSAAAQAQPIGEDAVRFQFTAPESCPNLQAFTAQVQARTERLRVAGPEELARTFTVTIATDTTAATGFNGSVEFLDDSGSSVSRRVRGERCDEVVSSLALITALALEARLEPEPEVAPALDPPPAPPPPAASAPPPPPVRESRWERDTGQGPSARVGVSGGYAVPLRGYAIGLLGQLDWPRSSRLGALRVRGHYAENEREVDAGRYAELRLIGLEASACPRALLADPFVVYGCLALDVGSLRARGVESPELPLPDSSTVLWVAVGAELRLAWQPDAPFWLELTGQLGTPLVRHTFRFRRPDASAFEAEPGLSASGGIVSGVRFF